MNKEPRISLILAVFFTGVALLMASGKGHLPPLAGTVGNVLMIAALAWLVARAWYLPNGNS